jgi:hypothetical protein
VRFWRADLIEQIVDWFGVRWPDDVHGHRLLFEQGLGVSRPVDGQLVDLCFLAFMVAAVWLVVQSANGAEGSAPLAQELTGAAETAFAACAGGKILDDVERSPARPGPPPVAPGARAVAA